MNIYKLKKEGIESFIKETCGIILEKAGEAFQAQANFNGIRRLYNVN